MGSHSQFPEAAVSQECEWMPWPFTKPKYKGHRELFGVIYAKNDLPWAPNTAHLFSESLLSPYCMADPVVGDSDRINNRPESCPNEVQPDKEEEEKESKDSLFAFVLNILYYNMGMEKSPNLKM